MTERTNERGANPIRALYGAAFPGVHTAEFQTGPQQSWWRRLLGLGGAEEADNHAYHSATDASEFPAVNTQEVLTLFAYVIGRADDAGFDGLERAANEIRNRLNARPVPAGSHAAQYLELIPATGATNGLVRFNHVRFETPGLGEATAHDILLSGLSAPKVALYFYDCAFDTLYLWRAHLLTLVIRQSRPMFQPGIVIWGPDLRLENDLILEGDGEAGKVFALGNFWGLRANDVFLSGPFIGGRYLDWRREKGLPVTGVMEATYAFVMRLDDCRINGLHATGMMSYGCLAMRHGEVRNMVRVIDSEFADYPRDNASVFAIDFRAAQLGDEFQLIGLRDWSPGRGGVRGDINLSLAHTRILALNGEDLTALGKHGGTFRVGLSGFQFEHFGEMRAREAVRDGQDADYAGRGMHDAGRKPHVPGDLGDPGNVAAAVWTLAPGALIQLLNRQPTEDLGRAFKAQPWTQFAMALSHQGAHAAANGILHERERRAHRAMRLGGRWHDWALWGAAAALPGYGYRLWRVLLAALVTVGLGVPVYSAALLDGRLVRTNGVSPGAHFDAALYSLDVVLPLVSIGTRERWTPAPAVRKAEVGPGVDTLTLTTWLQTAMGWYLAFAAAMGVSLRTASARGK